MKISPKDLLSALEWRYAAKSFDAQKKIPAEAWDVLEKSLILTPSSYGLQPWKFIVVEDFLLREKLKTASWNQKQVTECSHYVVFTQKTSIDAEYVDSFMQSIVDTRGVSLESLAGFKKGISGDVLTGPRSQFQMEWAARQLYIALGNFMTCAAVLGIDTCPMEGLDPKKYDEILEISGTGYQTVVACAAGYRNPADFLAQAKKVRFPADKVLQKR
jgi:nitroreductase